ncbi:cingulin-like protein 1 isoform X3 [Xiphophorus hellerii]|uniref:cingulin-like protein 1 isoform X3 n=1 Tax=Xiphophorus hellerii TaxID=8084 RepID=UPI0013B47530|nr:cingulin-like protein 1 isoform X3 [Xiphophorus hellerii]
MYTAARLGPPSRSPTAQTSVSLSSGRKTLNMNVSADPTTPGFQRSGEELPVSVDELRQLIEDKVSFLWLATADNQQGSVLEENPEQELSRFAALSQDLTFHLQELQSRTEQELRNIQTQLCEIEGRLQQLTAEPPDLQQKKKRTEEEEATTASRPQTTAKFEAIVADRLIRSEQLVFQEQALSALRDLLTLDLHRYQEESRKLTCFTEKIIGRSHRSNGEKTFICAEESMQGKNEAAPEKNMESEVDSSKQSDSPSEEEPSTPRATMVTQNPKYQLLLNHDLKTNGLSSRESNGPGGGGSIGDKSPRLSRWETTRLGTNNFRGSLESLASRDWDTGSDRTGIVDSPPRVFNSPYATTTSVDYTPTYRMSEYKVQGGLSPATSEMNLYSFNSRSTSPIGMPTPSLTSQRTRFSTYDTLRRRPEMNNTQVAPVHYSLRSATLGAPNKKDFIEELTKQLDVCQKRNTFLEAESVEMEKERNQIRFEMRALLVNNEDLLRTNAQLNNELKRTREQIIEMDKESQGLRERCREMEIEVKDAREMMVEANNQEYAFNFLQQSLKNKIQDAEDNLEKQTQHAQSLAEKLWLAERQLEEMEVDKETRDKKTSELNSTILRLEEELSEALQSSTQNSAEVNLHLKLREDAQMRVEELEEALLEKDQEVQKLQLLVSKLQGEVSGKLIDKERSLEEEIQLRERLQLQCRQAERTVDDLTMELHSTNQAKDDLAKQVKVAQEKLIDVETELEELLESEQRWAAKHKKTIEQTEQLQLKLIQAKDLNDQLEMDKTFMERQIRELRMEVEELQSSRVQEDVVSRAESRAKELESALRAEERNKATLTNSISKLERKINELNDQLEEETRIANEQKELMTQRMRTLKRQLNEAEEEATRKEAQYRHLQRELTEERETSSRLQRQLLDQHLQTKRKDNLTIRQTLDNLRLDLSGDEDDEEEKPLSEQPTSMTKV